MKNFTNNLINETSPYLLQHAHNPVNWHPWGQDALQKAIKEDKPILVSIGYSACHWCHVMEKESFENVNTATYMNDHFINIKIDREERPDLDHIYMDAVQAMTGSGGWPLNVFLTPKLKPFYGGTYFPPERAYSRPSWMETLQSISQTFNNERQKIEEQAGNIMAHLEQANMFGVQDQGKSNTETLTDKKTGLEIFGSIMKQADADWGGFGKAPKFPQTFAIQYLFRYYHFSKNEEALQQALLSIDKMIEGGIYDHLGGGFARYSTDAEWLAPHFEKMLYDNALLVSLISEAYQLTKREEYRQVIEETMLFIERELMHPDSGFYSALDADSEGVEGKYYVWQYDEIKDILGDDAAIFCKYYDITPKGNWEHTNILRTKQPLNVFASSQNINKGDFETLLRKCRQILLTVRNKRVRPGLDDKIILGWNALMNMACSKAFEATGNFKYKELAEKNMNFLFRYFEKDGAWFHTWKSNEAKYPAFLDDYSSLISALIQLQQITGNKYWLLKAADITGIVLDNFSEEDGPYFYFTHQNQRDVILRKKEIYDGATPSGNSMMADNLFQLSYYFDNPIWRKRGAEMLAGLSKIITSYPTSFGAWAGVVLKMIYPLKEIAVVGKKSGSFLPDLLNKYIPHKILMASNNADDQFPLLTGRQNNTETLFYLCQNFTCQKPVNTIAELLYLMSLEKG
ncbi:MAG TPA: thioredoxin domain-containing protein [Chitinophagaceae bacterium]|jgi:Highly conserved protein containing a thioredoxin domain